MRAKVFDYAVDDATFVCRKCRLAASWLDHHGVCPKCGKAAVLVQGERHWYARMQADIAEYLTTNLAAGWNRAELEREGRYHPAWLERAAKQLGFLDGREFRLPPEHPYA